MAIGNMDLYRALREAGASHERASAAARSVAGYALRSWFIYGMLAALTALVLGGLGVQWHLLDRLARFDLERIEDRPGAIEARLPPP